MKKFKKIYVEITNICNLNCSFCSKDKRRKKELSLNEFEIILNKINNYTDYLYLHVKGEPLLHSEFENILKLCKKYNKQVNITTNGTLLKKQIDKILNSDVVRQVNISMHSLKNSDIKDILECSKLLSDKGIYVVFRFWVYNNLQNNLINEIETYFNIKVNSDLDNTKVIDNIYINKDEEFIWPSLDNKEFRKNGTCLGLKTHIAILSDGTVIPCCLDSGGVINLGNIFEEDLDTILNKEKTKNIINGFNNNKLCEELCQKCGFKR